jgi:hypothetical protein
MDRVGAKALRAKWTSIRSRQAIADAHDDLESHQRWLDQHRAAWVQDVKLCERKLKRRLRTQALKRLALTLFLIAPITCLALLRLMSRLLPSVRARLFRSVARLQMLAGLTYKRLVSHLSSARATKKRNKTHDQHRIEGLDGPLCTGQPASARLVVNSEASLLPVRLIVASFAAVIVGFLAAAATSDSSEDFGEPSPDFAGPAASARAASAAASNQTKDAERLAPEPISGFALVAAAPAGPRVSPARATIDEIISLTQPWPNTLDQPATTVEVLNVTLPTRKPRIKSRVKSKRKPEKQKHKLTLWEQLPWGR